ncbi:alpha-hydroxy acid oxidase [Sporichthya sp.]|uniref:alpha-hydroxy acid oxidase n=1 Tax=Sporichthya sp. TaxID=65475 RepID=UPI00179EE3CD|nr:alpha-hydroxy acid oxidase [Sporichthya sp.]MBA3744777.1 alpha-hydroxy-acid oxidizing protein [Sporichthya sp.]
MDFEPLESAARGTLPLMAYDYFAGGSDDEASLRDNVAAWQRIRLRPRVLRDVSVIDTSTTVLGTPVALPVLVAPVGYQAMAHPGGECDAARGTAAAGSLYIASTVATTRLEDIAAAAGPRWMQVYVQKERHLTEAMIKRAAAAGYTALVLTVDLPVVGRRRRDETNSFTLAPGLTVANFGVEMPSVAGQSGLAAQVGRDMDADLTPRDIAWLSEVSGLPVLVKGVLRGDDARAAVDAGAAGVVVSNHGGRQLDTAIAGADALPEVVAAVGGDAEIYVDGGIRAGTDVLKAVAMGARAVLVGRPMIWGLATGGAAGVEAVLTEFKSEFANAMALCGARSIGELTRDLVVR